jgi:hypothetical protein
MLGHTSIVTTADAYTSVLPEAAHRAAQAPADMIIEAARSAPLGIALLHLHQETGARAALRESIGFQRAAGSGRRWSPESGGTLGAIRDPCW